MAGPSKKEREALEAERVRIRVRLQDINAVLNPPSVSAPLAYLRKVGHPMKGKAIAEAIGWTQGATVTYLSRDVAAGLVWRPSVGEYEAKGQ